MQITFNTADNKLIVGIEDGEYIQYIEYTNKEDYLLDHPERTEDCVSMGWE